MTSLANMPGHPGVVYRALAAANGAVVTRDALLDAMYGERAWCGDQWTHNRLRKVISSLRERGASIYTYGRHGWALGVPQQVKLAPIQRRILLALHKTRGEVVPYEQLISTGWPDKSLRNPKHSLRVEVNRLRVNVCVDIRAVPSEGYRLLGAAA